MDIRFDERDGRLENPVSGIAVTLRPQVGRLLAVLLEQRGEVVHRDAVRVAVWGEDAVVDFDAGLAALLRELRKAFVEVGLDAALIETIPRRGYRLHRTAPKPDPGARRSQLLIAVAFIGLTGVAAAWYFLAGVPEEPPYDPNAMTLAILPFERFGDTTREPVDTDLLLPDALLEQLWQAELPGLELIGRASLRPYEGQSDIAVQVAEDLGVNLLIEGTVVADEEGWRVTARLLHMPRGQVLWSASVVTASTDPLSVSTTVEQFISGFQDNFSEISARFHGTAPPGDG